MSLSTQKPAFDMPANAKAEIFFPTPNSEVERFVEVLALTEGVPEDLYKWILVYAPGEKSWYATAVKSQDPVLKQKVIVGSVDCDGAYFKVQLFITNKEGSDYLASFDGGIAQLPPGASFEISVRRKNRTSVHMHDNRTITISDSTNTVVGDFNTQNIDSNIEAILKAIHGSKGTSAEKEEARTLLKRFLEHPLVSSIVGGVIGRIGS